MRWQSQCVIHALCHHFLQVGRLVCNKSTCYLSDVTVPLRCSKSSSFIISGIKAMRSERILASVILLPLIFAFTGCKNEVTNPAAVVQGEEPTGGQWAT